MFAYLCEICYNGSVTVNNLYLKRGVCFMKKSTAVAIEFLICVIGLVYIGFSILNVVFITVAFLLFSTFTIFDGK